MKTMLMIAGVRYDMPMAKISAITTLKDAANMSLRDAKMTIDLAESYEQSRVVHVYDENKENYVAIIVNKFFAVNTLVENISTRLYGIVTKPLYDTEVEGTITVRWQGYRYKERVKTTLVRTIAEPMTTLADAYVAFEKELHKPKL